MSWRGDRQTHPGVSPRLHHPSLVSVVPHVEDMAIGSTSEFKATCKLEKNQLRRVPFEAPTLARPLRRLLSVQRAGSRPRAGLHDDCGHAVTLPLCEGAQTFMALPQKLAVIGECR